MSPDLLSGRPTCTTLSVLSGDDQNSWAVIISTAARQGNDFWGKMVPSWLQVADKESGWTDRGREGPFSTHAGSYLKHNTPSGLFLRLYSQTVSLRWCLSCCPVSWPAFKHRPKTFLGIFVETLYMKHIKLCCISCRDMKLSARLNLGSMSKIWDQVYLGWTPYLK